MKKITVAIDGFSANGKSTMAKALAKIIGYIYIDTGAMYRAVTLYCIQNGFFHGDKLNESRLKEAIDKIGISFVYNNETGTPDTYLNGIDVEKEIRSEDVTRKVSIVSAVGFVRHRLVKIQQEMGQRKGVVMDGRDIGTVVFPDAELKIYTTATPEIRAERRLNEWKSKGIGMTSSYEQVLEDIKKRDYLDQTREEGPLRQADDAILLDNTNMTREEQMDWLLEKFNSVVNKQ